MDELKMCPFCGAELREMHIKVRGFDGKFEKNLAFEHPKVGCIMDEWQVLDSEIEAWNRRTQPENKPLSLEELRQMDGSPVYLKTNTSRGDFYALVKHINPKENKAIFSYDCCGWSAYLDDYGKTWLAYAHKPEQEEK